MIKYLIHRPISVLVSYAALFILGIIVYMNIPVSLLPRSAKALPSLQVKASLPACQHKAKSCFSST
ncbi:MAG: efflux RND transporter permease subunit [Tannerella sp.]|jgi:multidrug efflux pump subunit AcrB|nr:efflux RND transporter permease subunit [Tannerella sp.]